MLVVAFAELSAVDDDSRDERVPKTVEDEERGIGSNTTWRSSIVSLNPKLAYSMVKETSTMNSGKGPIYTTYVVYSTRYCWLRHVCGRVSCEWSESFPPQVRLNALTY